MPPLILSPTLKFGDPLGGGGCMSTHPTCRPLLILSPALKCSGRPRWQGLCSHGGHTSHMWTISDFVPRFETWGRPRWQGLCSHPAHLWANSDFVPRSEASGISEGDRGYAATQPSCGPPLILSPALKRLGTPSRQGLCRHPAHLWTTSNCVPRSQALGTPQAAMVM